MQNEKKEYLKQYMYQESVIRSLNQLAVINPEKKSIYRDKISQALKTRSDIEEKISSVEDTVLRELLYNKYIFGKTLEEISYILNYSKRHIERLHIKALEKIEI